MATLTATIIYCRKQSKRALKEEMSNKKNKRNENFDEQENLTVDGYRQDRGEIPSTDKLKKSGFWRKIPALLRVWLINAWFGGAIFLFIGWGVPHITSDNLDLVAALGLTFGLAGDVIINNVLLTIVADSNPQKRIMYHTKSVWSVLINCLYGIALSVLITLFYAAVNIGAEGLGFIEKGGVWLGAEPILVGVLYATLNLLAVLVKNLIKSAVKKKSGAEE